MTPERRQELVRRRRHLKAQRVRRPLELHRRRFRATLDEAGVRCSLTDDEPLVEWITSRFNLDQWCSIDWRDVKRRRCVASDVDAPPELLVALAAEEGLGDPEIAVAYADPAFPSLKMRYGELARHADVILDFNWQTWALDPASDWIIEFHHDLGWRWGKAAEPNTAMDRSRVERSGKQTSGRRGAGHGTSVRYAAPNPECRSGTVTTSSN